MKKTILLSMVIIIAAAFAMACDKLKPQPKEKVEVIFHVMSQCPFGVQVENGIKPVLDKIGKSVDFKLAFIGNETAPGQFTSLHGEPEVKGDLLQVCAAKIAPEKYMDVIFCMNKNSREIPGNFKACADEVKVDAAKITACADGEEGKKLLSDSFKFSTEKNAKGSPTISIGGKPYNGGRKGNDFMRAICAEYKTAKPQVCSEIPEPKAVDMTVLTDARCKDCAPDRIVNQLKSVFPKLNAKTLDYGTPEGKQLYDSLKDKGVKLLPTFLFAPNVKDDEGFAQIEKFVVEAGTYKMLRIGAKFDPTAEICDNGKDDDGNGKSDCEDDNCKNKPVCRKEEPKKLDLFIMSQCPYGVMAGNAMKEVLDAFDKKINFNIHFIADETAPGKFNSLHGQPEVDEDIRELCAIKLAPKDYKYMDYILCRNKDIRSDKWEDCAKEAKIDVAKLKKCATTDEGTKLLSENIKLAKDLEIGGSPTWLANNKNQFSGIAAEQIKTSFCQFNKDVKGCEKKLSGDAGKAPQGGCGK